MLYNVGQALDYTRFSLLWCSWFSTSGFGLLLVEMGNILIATDNTELFWRDDDDDANIFFQEEGLFDGNLDLFLLSCVKPILFRVYSF